MAYWAQPIVNHDPQLLSILKRGEILTDADGVPRVHILVKRELAELGGRVNDHAIDMIQTFNADTE